MKRCQNDNPYYQEIVDRIFVFVGKLGGCEELERNKQAKRKQGKGRAFEERKQ